MFARNDRIDALTLAEFDFEIAKSTVRDAEVEVESFAYSVASGSGDDVDLAFAKAGLRVAIRDLAKAQAALQEARESRAFDDAWEAHCDDVAEAFDCDECGAMVLRGRCLLCGRKYEEE